MISLFLANKKQYKIFDHKLHVIIIINSEWNTCTTDMCSSTVRLTPAVHHATPHAHWLLCDRACSLVAHPYLHLLVAMRAACPTRYMRRCRKDWRRCWSEATTGDSGTRRFARSEQYNDNIASVSTQWCQGVTKVNHYGRYSITENKEFTYFHTHT